MRRSSGASGGRRLAFRLSIQHRNTAANDGIGHPSMATVIASNLPVATTRWSVVALALPLRGAEGERRRGWLIGGLSTPSTRPRMSPDGPVPILTLTDSP